LGESSCNCIPVDFLGSKVFEGRRRTVVDVDRNEGEGASHEGCLAGGMGVITRMLGGWEGMYLVVRKLDYLLREIVDVLFGRREGELDLLIEVDVFLLRVDAKLLGHRRRMILNLIST
jgi:hypothetical protein